MSGTSNPGQFSIKHDFLGINFRQNLNFMNHSQLGSRVLYSFTQMCVRKAKEKGKDHEIATVHKLKSQMVGITVKAYQGQNGN